MDGAYISCINCGRSYDIHENIYRCMKCGDLLEVKIDVKAAAERIDKHGWRTPYLSVWRYIDLMPILDPSKIVSLGEGGTTLHSCGRLGAEVGVKSLFVKNEGENPTGSFKDRGMTVGVTRALELGARSVICASTGNTSASLAAYSAKAGLTCYVIVPSGKIAYGKLAQAVICGSRVVRIKGNFDQALKIVLEFAQDVKDLYLLNSINPFRIEGQKTVAYEICEQLGKMSPDMIFMPIGNAGNISAMWKGLKEFKELGLIERLPKLVGVQSEGAAPIVKALLKQADVIEPVLNPETVASAIRIGSPVSWKKALRAIRESKGSAIAVSDREILRAQKDMARKEGLFVEPASASSIAGLRKMVERGEVGRDESVVCVATGHGLKDPEIVLKVMEESPEVDVDLDQLKKLLIGEGVKVR